VTAETTPRFQQGVRSDDAPACSQMEIPLNRLLELQLLCGWHRPSMTHKGRPGVGLWNDNRI